MSHHPSANAAPIIQVRREIPEEEVGAGDAPGLVQHEMFGSGDGWGLAQHG
ncbi:MAG: hypothetical protein ACLP3R_07540 [Candidatus Korobacteraceae bacterium]